MTEKGRKKKENVRLKRRNEKGKKKKKEKNVVLTLDEGSEEASESSTGAFTRRARKVQPMGVKRLELNNFI